MSVNPPDPHYQARLVDVVDNTPVYAVECHQCGTADRDISRIIDIVRQPEPIPEGEEALVPVFAQVLPCQKDWVGEEEYTLYDFGGSPYTRSISKEMTIVLQAMNDCVDNGATCIYELLTYSGTNSSWIGGTDLVGGHVGFEVFGTWDGIDEHWYLTLTGCPTVPPAHLPLTQPLTMSCQDPLYMEGTGGGGPFTVANCCDATPAPAVILIWAKIPPIYVARHVGMDGNDPVYASAECCPESCPFNPGCCDGIAINAGLIYTVFNVVTTTPNPPCTRSCGPGASVSATTSLGCVTFSITNCSGPHTVCLSCSLSASTISHERGWENYRISLLGNDYPPVAGSCDPFFVTFENIPWTSPSPGGTCSGTCSITVTR
jgi:hypothetical protein